MTSVKVVNKGIKKLSAALLAMSLPQEAQLRVSLSPKPCMDPDELKSSNFGKRRVQRATSLKKSEAKPYRPSQISCSLHCSLSHWKKVDQDAD